MRHLCELIVARERARRETIPGTQHLEVHAVQVHRVVVKGEIDDAPMHGFAGLVAEHVSHWPREPVDRADIDNIRARCPGFSPQADDQNPVVRVRARRVHDERTTQLAINVGSLGERRAPTGRRPVVIGAGRAGPEGDLTRFSSRHRNRRACGRVFLHGCGKDRHGRRQAG